MGTTLKEQWVFFKIKLSVKLLYWAVDLMPWPHKALLRKHTANFYNEIKETIIEESITGDMV